MTPPAVSMRPRLASGCRLSETAGQEATLLMPEGALRLNGPALKIVQFCDGRRTVAEIVQELKTQFPAAKDTRMEEDTMRFLETLREKRAVDFE